jgi:PAS domain S-box-containing protein
VEAGVGVDFDASRWVTAILIRRLGVLGFFAVAVAIVIWTGGLLVLARHEASSRLAAERRIKTILDNEPEGVFVCDADGTLRQANPSGLHLLELSAADDWRSKALPAYVPDAERAATDAWLKAVAAGRAGTQLVRLVGTRGGEKWVDAHAVPLRDWTDESTGERRDGVLIVARDVTAARAAEAERDRLQQQLMDASRRAGMAEVATGVLHNVGNVLNTVNISTHMLADKLRQSRVPRLGQAAEMLQQHRAQLGVFLTADERGRQFPDYLEKLSGSLRQEQEEMLSTVRSLSEALDHLKAIVQSQQSFAANVNVVETVRATAVFEEALKLNISSCERHHVKVEREFEDDLPPVTIDKHKTLQILINLISNAKNAIKASPNQAERQITLRLSRGTSGGAPTVRFQVKDNGVGIAPENLTKVFGMGFTTRKDGHGFGLHSSANFANEMGGRLTVSSEGVGLGAAFCLELPVVPPATQPLHEQRHHAGAVREAA